MGRTKQFLQVRTRYNKTVGRCHGSLVTRNRTKKNKWYHNKGKTQRVAKKLAKRHDQQMQSQQETIQSLQSKLKNANDQAVYWEQCASDPCSFGKATLSDSCYSFNSTCGNDDSDQDDVDKPNNYFKYSNDIILGVIELRSAGVSAAAIPHVIEVVLKMYNVYETVDQQHTNGFIPSSSTIRNYVTYYGKKCSDIQLAIELHDGNFAGNGHTMIRDGSSYYGRHMEALVICTQNQSCTDDCEYNERSFDQSSSQTPPNKHFVTRLMTLPQIAAKDSITIAETLHEDIKCIDHYSRELFDDVDNDDTILNQFSEYMTDGLAGEQLVTDYLTSKQTENVSNTRYKCLQHGLNALCENGVKTYLTNRNNPFGDNYSQRDIFYLIMLLCKLFGNTDYAHNRRDDFQIFCERSNANDNKYCKLPKFPTTRIFHALRYVVDCIDGLPQVQEYLQRRQQTWKTEYKSELALSVDDFDLIRQSLYAVFWHDCFFVLLERYWINSSVDFKIGARKFLQAFYEMNYLSQHSNTLNIFLYTSGLRTFGTRMPSFSTDHGLYTILNDNEEIDIDLNHKFKHVDITDFDDDLDNDLNTITLLRICIAATMCYLSDESEDYFVNDANDCRSDNTNTRLNTMTALIEILFDDDSLQYLQNSQSSNLEYCIYKRFGATHLASLWYEASIMFEQSFKFVLMQFDKKIKDIKTNGKLSQDFLTNHESASNVPSTSCMAEGVFGQFKQLASRCKQMKHKQNAALQLFGSNKVWNFYTCLSVTNYALYRKAIELLVSNSWRKS